MADIDDEHGACFAAEYVEVGDVEADILASNWRIEVMGQGSPPLSVRLAIQTVEEISVNLLGAIHVMTAVSTLMLLARESMHFFCVVFLIEDFTRNAEFRGLNCSASSNR